MYVNPVGWGYKIHRLNECPVYDTKPSNGEAPVMREFGGIRTHSLPSLPGPILPEVVAPNRVPSVGQIKLFDI